LALVVNLDLSEIYDQSKDDHLDDNGVGTASLPLFNPEHSISQVNNDTEEFQLMDGVVPIGDASFYASHCVASGSN